MDCTNNIIWAIFNCHILTSSSFKYCIGLEILGNSAVKIVTVRNCDSINYTSLMVLSSIIIIQFKSGQNLYMPQAILNVHPH